MGRDAFGGESMSCRVTALEHLVVATWCGWWRRWASCDLVVHPIILWRGWDVVRSVARSVARSVGGWLWLGLSGVPVTTQSLLSSVPISHGLLHLPVDVTLLKEESISLWVLDGVRVSLYVLTDLVERMLASES